MAENKDAYEGLSVIEHIKKRPETYVGSVSNEVSNIYVVNKTEDGKDYIAKTKMLYNDGFVRIHLEILYNAIDNIVRSGMKSSSPPCDVIKITVTDDTMSIENNGLSIPIQKKKDEDTYIPEFIFGTFMTGSNFNDDSDRYTTGKNGFGAKLTNIFSSTFSIKIIDPESKKQYEQTWNDQMSTKSPPKITDIKSTKIAPLVKITWKPLFSYFKIADNRYSDDYKMLFKKMAYDIKGNCLSCNIYFNGEKLSNIKNFGNYCSLYFKDGVNEIAQTKCNKIEEIDEYESNIVIIPSNGEESCKISFINGLYTPSNGIHYDMWSNEILKGVIASKHFKSYNSVSPNMIKDYFNIFVSCRAPNPEFCSQSKKSLKNVKQNKTITVSEDAVNQVVNKIVKTWSDTIENIKEFLDSKNTNKLKKAAEQKKKVSGSIDNYDRANNSNTKYSQYCSLLLCEGLSAKTYAVAGMKYIDTFLHKLDLYDKIPECKKSNGGFKGRDWIGVYPLRGVLLNSRNASNEQITKNREIVDIMSIMNLEQGIDYSDDDNYNKLSYGRIVILTDADVDGSRIKGLLLNMFHNMFKNILKKPIIYGMNTPILKVMLYNKSILFYNEYLANSFINTYIKEISTVKYYKGLGTSNDDDIKLSFSRVFERFVSYNDNDTDNAMEIMFNKHSTYSDKRKELIINHEDKLPEGTVNSIFNSIRQSKDKTIVVSDSEYVNIPKFIGKDMVIFSIANCERSIPNIIDGLKQSQRKILYGIFKKNLHYTGTSSKLAQLCGYIGSETNYHHGEQNLWDTAIKMAQGYVGSNNIPLLYPDGQFGSRTSLGDDAAAARYISTKIHEFTRDIYNAKDDDVLKYEIDDGKKVEPTYYVPIIPMVLINGCKGIATGFSTDIICYNVFDIIRYIRHWLVNKSFDDNIVINPWYYGFKGKITQVETNKWETVSNMTCTTVNKKNIISINEIPIHVSIEDFKTILEKLQMDKVISSLENQSTVNEPNFKFSTSVIDEGNISTHIKKFKSTLNSNNMTMFDENGKLRKYSDVYEVMKNYSFIRLDYYDKRKKYEIEILEQTIKKVSNRYRFLLAYRKDKSIINDKKTSEVKQYLIDNKYDMINDKYDYLLNQTIGSLQYEMLERLKKDLEQLQHELEELKKTEIHDMWLNELNKLESKLRVKYVIE